MPRYNNFCNKSYFVTLQIKSKNFQVKNTRYKREDLVPADGHTYIYIFILWRNPSLGTLTLNSFLTIHAKNKIFTLESSLNLFLYCYTQHIIFNHYKNNFIEYTPKQMYCLYSVYKTTRKNSCEFHLHRQIHRLVSSHCTCKYYSIDY